MTQIAFVTLFLGLTLGVQPVEIRVTGPVYRVELRLDGSLRGVIGGPPWRKSIDIGDELLPHRLSAIALDAAGHELARAEQMINVPRRAAETEILLERNASGQPAKAHLLWQSADADKPADASLTLDGAPLALDSKLTAVIGNVDTSRPHLLHARVKSPSGVIAETEIAFGGGLEGQTGRTLTGIPIRLAKEDAALTPETAKQWLTTPNGAPDVAGVEDLPGDVIIVRDPSNREAAARLESGWVRGPAPNPLAESGNAAVRHKKPQVRFVWPMESAAAKESPTYLMPLTRPFEFASADELKTIVARVAAPGGATRMNYADAVAVAGLRAAATQRPRAVVLLIGEGTRDGSELSPQLTSDYLRAIGVPLFVWSLVPPRAAQEWRDVTDVSTPMAFRRAFDALDRSLRAQRIVWINGDYLPNEVTVSPAGQGTVLQNRVEVHAIELTASVHDANGRVPRDLTPDDFVVLENGTPQRVIGVDYTEGATSQDRSGQVVIFIQQSLSSTKGLRLALESLASEAESVVAAGAVEVVTDDPRPHTLFGPTRDPIALRGFLQKLGGEITGQEELIRIRTAFAATDLSSDDPPGIAKLSRDDQTRMRARQESTALRKREDALVGWVSRYPSTAAGSYRTLLLVSDGFDLEPASSSRHEEIARTLASEHWTVISLATPNPAHAVTPSKFQSRVAPSIETTAPSHGIAPLHPVNQFPLAPLLQLADATGGEVVTDLQNAGTALREMTDRIVITYQTDHPSDDTLRPIEVTARRPGLTIRAPKWAGVIDTAAVR